MVKKSLERIKWRISDGGWKANKKDIEAINTVVDYVNSEQDRSFRSNEHLAKLCIHLYGKLLIHYDCTIYETHPEKALKDIFDKPIDLLLSDLTYIVNQQNQYSELAKNGFAFGHPTVINEDTKSKNLEILKKTKGELFTEDTVEENIISMVNNLLEVKSHRK